MNEPHPKIPEDAAVREGRPPLDASRDDRLQFSLRSAMIAIGVFCALLAWLKWLEVDIASVLYGVAAIAVAVGTIALVIDRTLYVQYSDRRAQRSPPIVLPSLHEKTSANQQQDQTRSP